MFIEENLGTASILLVHNFPLLLSVFMSAFFSVIKANDGPWNFLYLSLWFKRSRARGMRTNFVSGSLFASIIVLICLKKRGKIGLKKFPLTEPEFFYSISCVFYKYYAFPFNKRLDS
jgi:hypothetical protein